MQPFYSAGKVDAYRDCGSIRSGAALSTAADQSLCPTEGAHTVSAVFELGLPRAAVCARLTKAQWPCLPASWPDSGQIKPHPSVTVAPDRGMYGLAVNFSAQNENLRTVLSA